MIVVLVVVSPFLLFSVHVYSQPSWPASWIQIDWDKDEDGWQDDWRDVEYAYVQYDSSYLYLKLECYDIPGKDWPDSGRYKWLIDLEGDMYHSGENVYAAEYLLFVEDANSDGFGELYLIHNTDGDNTFDEYEPWPPANYTNYAVTNATIGGWRIVSLQMEMYVSWDSIGDPSAFWMTWATDQQNPNLDQGPTTDHVDEEQPIAITRAQYTLTVNVDPVGSGSVGLNDTGPYGFGDVVELTAVPNAGWSFSHWSGDLGGSANPTTITMDGNKTVTAHFIQEITYTLTITTTSGGTTSPSPGAHGYSSGTNVPVTAIPQGGYQFDHWELDSMNVGSANPYTVTMNPDHTLHAVFKEAPSPPPTVGGYALPINLDIGTSNSSFSQIGLASALSATVTAITILVRRRKKTSKGER